MTLWSLGFLLAFFFPHVAGKWRTFLTRCDFNVQSCLQSHRNHQNLRSRYRLRVEIRWSKKHKRGNDEEAVMGWTLGWYLGIFWVVPIVRKASMNEMINMLIYIYIVLLKLNMYMALAITKKKGGNAVVLQYSLHLRGSIILWWGWWPTSPTSSAPLASPWYFTHDLLRYIHPDGSNHWDSQLEPRDFSKASKACTMGNHTFFFEATVSFFQKHTESIETPGYLMYGECPWKTYVIETQIWDMPHGSCLFPNKTPSSAKAISRVFPTDCCVLNI